jgi:predicted subunit of tRNA(5-methylaminomethyl-2-thiouridylate) methyltransferase
MLLAAVRESSQRRDHRLPRLTMSADRSSEDRTDLSDVARAGARVLIELGMFLPKRTNGYAGR